MRKLCRGKTSGYVSNYQNLCFFTIDYFLIVMENGELSAYQLMIQKNIEENKRVLQSLGLSFGTHYKPKVSKPHPLRKSVSRSKGQQSIPQVEPLDIRPTRINTRRSSSILLSNGFNDSADYRDTNNDEENTPPLKKRRSEPVFGEIEGVRVGDWWPSRLDCSAAGVHRPTVAGIHGKHDEGCYSIALSGGYEDDLDCGTYFTYTGCGGRDLKGTKCNPKNLRTAPQSKDQVFEGLNAALASNIETKKPVRVIRGFKLQSDFAPEEGYRYDGLYSVEKYWTATGLSGFKVYKFALKRLENQDPPPWESCAESNPFLSKELQSVESNIIPTQVEEMDTTTTSVSCLKSCSSKLCPKISLRGRQRKQTSPKQHCQNYLNYTTDSDELAYDFLSQFKQELESDDEVEEVSSSEEASKVTVNIINHTKNESDSFPLKDHIDINFTTPTKSTTSVSLKNKTRTNVSILNSSQKKVRFSPTIMYNYGKDVQVQVVDYEKYVQNDNIDLGVVDNSDGKKQTTILNYFSPIKKIVKNQTPKNTINPKSLRSNRLSSCFITSSSDTPKYSCDFSINNHSPNCTSATSTVNGCTRNDKKLIGSPAKKSSSHKRKYSSSLTKHKDFDLDLNAISKKRPSMMENLIKQNSEKLKLHKQITPTKRKISPIKPCSVVLKRIKIEDFCDSGNVCIGWDSDGESFVGFDKLDLKGAKESYDNFIEHFSKSYNDNQRDSSEKLLVGFHGWNHNKDDFQGSSGLVSIAFMIDKLSKS